MGPYGHKGLPKFQGSFSEEKKSACGNVGGRAGLPKIQGLFFWEKKAPAAT